MPTSAETVLGFRLMDEEVDRLFRELGVDKDSALAPYDPDKLSKLGDAVYDEGEALYAKEVQERFERAYSALTEGIKTPARTTFSLTVYGDRDEIRDRYPYDFLIGVSLDSRYSPTWLDLDRPYGTSGALILDDPDTLKKIEMARDALAKEVPVFQHAKLFHKVIWY